MVVLIIYALYTSFELHAIFNMTIIYHHVPLYLPVAALLGAIAFWSRNIATNLQQGLWKGWNIFWWTIYIYIYIYIWLYIYEMPTMIYNDKVAKCKWNRGAITELRQLVRQSWTRPLWRLWFKWQFSSYSFGFPPQLNNYKFNIHTSPHPLRGAMANAAHSDMRRGPAPGALLSKSDIQQFEGS